MSVFSQILGHGLAAHFRVHSQLVTYSESPDPLRAVVGEEEVRIVDLESGDRTRRRQRSIVVKTADVSDPREGQLFTIDAEEWTVVETEAVGNGFAELILTRPLRTKHGGRRLNTK